MTMNVRLEFMRPDAIDSAIASCPTLFQPLGTIEWHGLHNAVGLDALKAHALCVHAAEQGGGLVAPPVFGGIGGLAEPYTFVIDQDDGYDSRVFRGWLERLCTETKRNGFKAMIILTGHYGAGQQILVREVAVRMSKLLNMPILGTPEYMLALDEGYTGDHAAYFETSLMMHLYPEAVNLDALGDPPHRGVGGRDPKEFANAEDGKRFADAIIGRLAHLARSMPTWDQTILDGFIAAEQALVNRQMTLAGQSGQAWTAWRSIGGGGFKQYAALLVKGRFEEIIALTREL